MTWWSSEELTSKQEGTEGFSPYGVYSLFVRVNRPNLIFWTPSRFLSSRISCLVREKVSNKENILSIYHVVLSRARSIILPHLFQALQQLLGLAPEEL